MIRRHLSDIINNHEWKVHLSNTVIDYKTQGEWKIQLKISVNFISSRDSDDTRTMHTSSDNVEIMIGNETDEVISQFFEYVLQRYQKDLEEMMKGSEFVFYTVDLLRCKNHKMSLNRGASYIDSPEQLKNKRAIINPKNNDDKCFPYDLTVALNYQNLKKSSKNIKN